MIIVAILAYSAFRYYRVHVYAWYTGFPKPKHNVALDRNVMVPMPDGTLLATDVYRPTLPGKYPVVLLRTPYNKSGTEHLYGHLGQLFASQGYVFIVQDVRGKFGSQGQFYPYAYEALDGHTTVNWAGEAPWSNGRVALYGFSYSGSCVWLAARYKSRYLRTIVTVCSTQDTYAIWIDKGMPFLKGTLFWLTKYSDHKENKVITHKALEPVLWKLPESELDVLATGRRLPFFREYLAHITPDEFWDEISATRQAAKLDIPALIIGGWYDPFVRGTTEDYRRMRQAPASSNNQFTHLEIGPWAHNPALKFVEGQEASFHSLLLTTLKWCDGWLKENRPSVKGPGKVRYYVLGKNEWREADDWPLPASQVNEQRFFLSTPPQVNGTEVQLHPSPSPEAYPSHFIYNPRDPVLFIGRDWLYGEGWISPTQQEEVIVKEHIRDDVLLFNSAPFDKDLIIVGEAKLVLYVSSQALDTDFCAKICDLHPNGKVFIITAAYLRMRFRDSLGNPEMMEPGKIYKVELSFRPTACAFLKGHRIQLQVTSSDFPVHNRNLNTGISCEYSVTIKEVVQTLYTGGEYESYLMLPGLKEAVETEGEVGEEEKAA